MQKSSSNSRGEKTMTHQGFASRQRTKQRNRKKHIKLELCASCSRKLSNKSKCYCEYHLKRNRENSRRYYSNKIVEKNNETAN